jgi:predicted DNA-binding WGR domain protein
MLKLYKNIDGKFYYWEFWEKDERTGTVHWGFLGERGESEDIVSSLFASFRKKIQKLIDQKIKAGYNEIEFDDMYTLLVEYEVDGMGTPEDIDKRYRLQEKMDETLGWTGLGHCDGGSIGSGSMEVCCYVVDFEVARIVIEKALQGTEFENYTRIYDENEE